MKTFLTFVGVFLLAACASAQPRPGAFTTINATAVTPAAVCAGCPIGSTSPAVNSGVTAAALVLPISVPANTTNTLYQGATGLFFGSATGFPIGGLLSVNGFGTHSISASGTGGNTLTIRNPTAGTGNYGALFVANDNNPTQTQLLSLSSTYTTSAPNLAGGSSLVGAGVGGLSVTASDPTGALRFYTGGVTERVRIFPDGNVSIGNTSEIGGCCRLNVQNAFYVGYDGINAYSTMTTGAIAILSAPSLVLSQMDNIGFFATTYPTTASAANAHIGNGDYLRLVTSLRSAKHDIEPISLFDARRTVMGLQSVLYRSSVDEDQRQWAGFIADDVEKVNPTLAVYDGRGALQSVTYDRVAAYLLRLVQDQEQRIEALEQALKAK
jgi:hypothetical protein